MRKREILKKVDSKEEEAEAAEVAVDKEVVEEEQEVNMEEEEATEVEEKTIMKVADQEAEAEAEEVMTIMRKSTGPEEKSEEKISLKKHLLKNKTNEQLAMANIMSKYIECLTNIFISLH